MHETDIRRLDLNLLVMLDALLAERSVTRAGTRLGLSQPAASRALGRLRDIFGDRLFVRTPSGLMPTPKAEALAGPVAQLLVDARTIITPDAFDPAQARGDITLATGEFQAWLLAPRLLRRFATEAPNLNLRIVPIDTSLVARLEQGAVDLALTLVEDGPAGFRRRLVYSDTFACLVRRDHPVLAESPLTPARYAALQHALISTPSTAPAPVDQALASVGLSRRVALRVPSFLAAPLIVADSDLILTCPRSTALRLAGLAPLTMLEPPLPIEGFDVSIAWHERRQDDPAHRWLRHQVIEAGRDLGTKCP